MPMAGVHITTIRNPATYTGAQLDRACEIAHQLATGHLILCVAPPHECEDELDEHAVCTYCHRLA